MKIPTPLVSVVGGGVGIAAAVIAFQAVTGHAAQVQQVADYGTSAAAQPSAQAPSVSETPEPSTEPSTKPTHREPKASSEPRQPKPSTVSTQSWSEHESESDRSYESGDD